LETLLLPSKNIKKLNTSDPSALLNVVTEYFPYSTVVLGGIPSATGGGAAD
jgi:hypothetical protein